MRQRVENIFVYFNFIYEKWGRGCRQCGWSMEGGGDDAGQMREMGAFTQNPGL